MGISLSGGDYQYNRFDAYEKSLEEGKGASDPKKMKKEVDKAAKKSKKGGRYLRDEDEKEEGEEEVSTAGEGSDGGGAMGEGYMPLPKEKMERQSIRHMQRKSLLQSTVRVVKRISKCSVVLQ